MAITSAVSVVGLGSMGTALAQALLGRGHKVTVWNRSSERAGPLVAAGATLAPTAADAVSASPLVIMCVLDYAAAAEILAAPGVAAALAGGKTFVQLSTGVPAQVHAQQAQVQAHGGRFIAGGIVAYPRSIGRPNAVILYAGDPSFHTHRETLLALAGSSQYLGADPASAVGAYFALSAYMIGALGLFFESAALSRNYGVSIDTYYLLARLVSDEVLEGLRDGAYRIASGKFDGKLASIDLTIAGMQEVCKAFNATGMPIKMTEALVESLKIASAAGAGDNDIAALTEAIWSHRKA